MSNIENAGSHIYVHVPFCDGKCAYCAFYSVLYDNKTADAYLKSLSNEMDLYLDNHSKPVPQTIYFGGGTPSILNQSQLATLCSIVRERVDASQLKEWTLEANPNTLPPEKLRILKEAGVNRISIGVQSFDDRVLKSVGRRHSSADVAPTLDGIRAGGIENIGIDLIVCLPRVDEEIWRDTLRKAIQLQPKHVSVYALSVEAGSCFARCSVPPPDDESQSRAGEITEELLEKADFERYEISNYSKPGFQCLHNLAYWRGKDYVGFGPAASSRCGLKRWTNKPDLDSYVAAFKRRRVPCDMMLQSGEGNSVAAPLRRGVFARRQSAVATSCSTEPLPRDEETLSSDLDAVERVMFAFRLLKEGVDLHAFGSASLVQQWENSLRQLSSEGLVEQREQRWFLTERGRDFADHVAAQFLPDPPIAKAHAER